MMHCHARINHTEFPIAHVNQTKTMNNQPYKILFIGSLLLWLGITLSAQDRSIMRAYDRPTIANLSLVFGDENEHEEKVRYALSQLPANPKFNLAGIDYNLETNLTVDDSIAMYNYVVKRDMNNRLRRFVSTDLEMYPADDQVGVALGKALQDNINIGADIFAEWATKSEDGSTFSVINERSERNLTVADYNRKTDAQKLATFKNLLLNNFVIVYNISDFANQNADGDRTQVSP